MQDNITERVIKVIADHQRIPLESVTPESTFAALNIDSLDGLHLLFALEDEFSVDIPDDAAREFTSVNQVITGLAELIARKKAGGQEQA